MSETFNPVSILKLAEQMNTTATSITQESSQQTKWTDLDSITETINSKVKSAINEAIGPAFDAQVKLYEKRIKETTSSAAKDLKRDFELTKDKFKTDLFKEMFLKRDTEHVSSNSTSLSRPP